METTADSSRLEVLAIVGAGGADEYAAIFAETAVLWEAAALKGGAQFQLIEGDKDEDSRDQIEKAITESKADELWIVLIGHGTFDGRLAKFNVRGPDFTDDEMASWIESYSGRLVLINGASASGSFIRKVGAPGRVVITSTKNEAEVFYSRFGKYFAEAISGLEAADVDNDDQVSLLEAWLYASSEVSDFFEREGRIATEHALIDDSGDQLGSRAEWFEGTTPTRTPRKDAAPDGDTAAQRVLIKNAFEQRFSETQRTRRDELERELKQLRRARSSLDEDDYYEQIESILVELAELYETVSEAIEPES
ncbi:MAG: hypothetical protein AAF236_14735 [Verrucomicrobiota bacterium]